MSDYQNKVVIADGIYTNKKRNPMADLHLNSQVKLHLDEKTRLKTNYARQHNSVERASKPISHYSPLREPDVPAGRRNLVLENRQ